MYIFRKSRFLNLGKCSCEGNLSNRFGLRIMAARFGVHRKTRTVVSTSIFLYFRQTCDIYTEKKCSEYLFISFVD